MSMAASVALVLAGVFISIAALHISWALASGRTSSSRIGVVVPTRLDGTPLFRPGRTATLGVALLLIIAGLLVLQQGGILTLPGRAVAYRLGIWLLGAVLVLRTVGDFRYVGMFKRERRTRFAARDTRVYTPLCGVLAAGVLYLAANR
jgi:hypothetical protein